MALLPNFQAVIVSNNRCWLKVKLITKFAANTLEAIDEPQLVSEENLEDAEPPDDFMDVDPGGPGMDEPEDESAETYKLKS